MSILFVGCNTGDRFEGPVVEACEQSGIKFKNIVGLDMSDYTSHLAPSLKSKVDQGKMSYVVADLTSPDFMYEGQFDCIVVSWSMLNDVLKKVDLMTALQRLNGLLKPGGYLICDTPYPHGEHSYQQSVEEYAEELGTYGLVLREFDIDGHKLKTMFNILNCVEWCARLQEAGITVQNFPDQIQEQVALAHATELDDSALVDRGDSSSNTDPLLQPVYYAKANRVTLAAKKTGPAGAGSLPGTGLGLQNAA
jgi:SAM-dependent methyltransferase